MTAAGVPTAARSAVHARAEEVAAALDAFGAPYVVKDDGLAAGKGVVVTEDRARGARARGGVRAGGHRGVPRRTRGLAVRASADGDAPSYPLQPAQDFKRIFDGDEGPNTGGMGAYTPLPWAPADLVDEVQRHRAPADRRRDGAARHAVRRDCCTPASRSPRAACGWWSSTPASGTPRPSRCWPCSTRRSSPLLLGGGDRDAGRRAASGLEAGRRGRRGDGLGRLPRVLVVR